MVKEISYLLWTVRILLHSLHGYAVILQVTCHPHEHVQCPGHLKDESLCVKTVLFCHFQCKPVHGCTLAVDKSLVLLLPQDEKGQLRGNDVVTNLQGVGDGEAGEAGADAVALDDGEQSREEHDEVPDLLQPEAQPPVGRRQVRAWFR